MPDDQRNRMLGKLTELIRREDEAKSLPTADELAQGLMTTIGVVGDIAEREPIRLRNQTTTQESTRQPAGDVLTFQEMRTDLNPNLRIAQEQFGKKPGGITNIDKLPFLKDIDPELRQPQQFLTETGDIVTEGEPKRKDLTFQQRALNQINSTLLKLNLHDSGIGELSREIITPIIAGGYRVREGQLQARELKAEGLGNIALGIAGIGFGTFMMPFGLARATGEQLGGETGAKIAELTSLGLAGGIPLIAGYFASTGATGLADKLMEGSDLTDKQIETVQDVVGLTAFLGGVKAGAKIKGKVNAKLQAKLEKYHDGLPVIVKADIKPLTQP